MKTFSIVINTYNRADGLRQTLKSLMAVNYTAFEIVVVNGPSTDHTERVIDDFSKRIKTAVCDVRNLSVSRNIGISAAAGDIVAFIDDDAMPEPEWLMQLAAAFDSEEIGAVGGKVFDHTGYNFQYQYATADRLGNAQWQLVEATPHLNFPCSMRFPYLQGTNTSFRRSALLEIGGFDEEYEYYLDETDVCLRLNDAGYIIRQLPNAFVHHKFLPSHVRDENRVAKYRFPVIKNKIYFALKNARGHVGMQEIIADVQSFIAGQFSDVDFHIAGGRLDQAALDALRDEVERSWLRGFEQGLLNRRELLTVAKARRYWSPFKNALSDEEVSRLGNRRNIVLVSRDYPPNHAGGIATFNKDLAVSLAAEGNVVVVVTESVDVDRVDFEDGVWVHRLVTRNVPLNGSAATLGVPQHIWDWSSTAHREVERIGTHRSIDVVETPIWDCEGIAFLLDRQWPLVVSLQTTLHFWLESHPGHRELTDWMASFAQPMLALEEKLMREADGVRSISGAIAQEIEAAYGFEFDRRRLSVLPLGMAALPAQQAAPGREAGGDTAELSVLFVGRLEPRKGIDILLEAIPRVLDSVPSARFRIVGDNTLPGPGGQPYSSAFLASAAGQRYGAKVVFEGRVDETALQQAYATCDLFVAPSRFESFGLVFLEAMRAGKPVIGCRAGGMPEVVADGHTGVLVPPGDVSALAEAIVHMLRSAELRTTMGVNGEVRFHQHFTAERMARDSHEFYASVRASWQLAEEDSSLVRTVRSTADVPVDAGVPEAAPVAR